LKASELSRVRPGAGSESISAQGFETSPEYACQAIRELPHGKWRDYNPEETVRFYALGMVKGAPQKLIAQGTDWRFLNEPKKELKT